jgi:hypothetical protein
VDPTEAREGAERARGGVARTVDDVAGAGFLVGLVARDGVAKLQLHVAALPAAPLRVVARHHLCGIPSERGPSTYAPPQVASGSRPKAEKDWILECLQGG